MQVDVLITNGGYGTIQQSLRAGVPLIVSGVGQDKSHTGALINYIGNGIYNAVHEASPEMLSGAFEEILRNQSYRYVFSPHQMLACCGWSCVRVLTGVGRKRRLLQRSMRSIMLWRLRIKRYSGCWRRNCLKSQGEQGRDRTVVCSHIISRLLHDTQLHDQLS